jgi:competence protein ComGC
LKLFNVVTKNEQGFTLIEMMIVLMIISILLLIAIPNMTSNNKIANDRGCAATIDLLQAQVGAYYVENKRYPEKLDDLIGNYVDTIVCPNGTQLTLNSNKKVVVKEE